eukprot:GILI01013192.1.p1 GENE.GILI01013192.1~~GILI01013192.1.p1  ORF type:complete len:252 (+),score=58.12 GILI01013192.1:152-907(+)
MSSPEEWYKSLPVVTRAYLTGAFVTTVLTSMKLVSPMAMLLDFGAIWHKFQVWRLLSSFLFFGSFSFNFVFQMFMLVRHFSSLEKHPSFMNRTADFVFFVAFEAIVLMLIAYLFPFPILGPSLVFAVIYVWSKREPLQPVSFFSFVFQGFYLPWVLLAFSVLIGNSVVPDLLGIAVGHLYFFLKDVMPVQYGKDFLQTPSFLYRFFPVGSTRVAYFGASPGDVRHTAAPAAVPPSRFNAFGGSGRVLGTNQ